MTPSAPKVAAVTLNWHDTEGTLACLRSLEESPLLEPVIAVDNESDGSLGTAVAAAGLRSVVVPMPENRGFAGGINPGLEEALAVGADFVLVINNDATIDPASVEALVAAAERDVRIGAVGPLIVHPDGTVQTLGVRWGWCGARLVQLQEPGPVDSLTWACVLLRADCLREVGLLDERFFMYWEDFEFCRRLTDAGWRLHVEPAARAVHALSSSGRRAGSKLAIYYFWGLLTLMRVRPGLDRLRSVVRLVTLLGKRIVRLDRPGLAAARRGIGLARHQGKGYEILGRHPL